MATVFTNNVTIISYIHSQFRLIILNRDDAMGDSDMYSPKSKLLTPAVDITRDATDPFADL